MLIDWFTVVAQTLNFLILVWLMKRFLYKPVLNAIDAREKRIAAELSDAATRQAEAAAERTTYQQRNVQFDQQRAGLLSRAVEDANLERQHLLEQARNTAADLVNKRQQALETEAAALGQTLTRRTREEVFSIARKTLSDLAACPLEERIAAVFVQRLSEMNASAKALLGEALKAAAEPARVASAFELPSAQRDLIQQAINTTFSDTIPLVFEIIPELISGIELKAGGQKIAWSISDYLKSLEESVTAVLVPQAPAAVSS